jgi:two-component system chemotaxis response regulator CheB
MVGHNIVAIGASAGGVETLLELVRELPADFPAAVFIVVHFPDWGKSHLPKILAKNTSLPVAHAVDGEAIVPGRIYIGPPDYHLLIKRNFIRLVQGPHENGFRPAIDPLFRTAARVHGARTVAVVLTGLLDDGTAGLMDVKKQGGIAIVQDPDEALFASMPRSAIESVAVDYILPVAKIAAVLNRLAREPVIGEGGKSMSDSNSPEFEELDIVEIDGEKLRQRGTPGPAAGFICPDCGGSLYEVKDREGLLQFRCRVGHAWSATSLMAGKAETQEHALWAAIYSLEERAELMERMAQSARDRKRLITAARYEAQVQSAQQRADLIRLALFQGQLPQTDPSSEEDGYKFLPPFSNAAYDVVVFVAAEGGLAALSRILPALPLSFPAAVIVVQKLNTASASNLTEATLDRPTTLSIKYPEAEEPIHPGRIYVASTEAHLLVNPNSTFSLVQAAFVDWARPSADLLLQSVAATFKQRAIAVILSGTGKDGLMGIQAIHQMGGSVIVQAENTCEFPELPHAAIQTQAVDHILPLSKITLHLIRQVRVDAAE